MVKLRFEKARTHYIAERKKYCTTINPVHTPLRRSKSHARSQSRGPAPLGTSQQLSPSPLLRPFLPREASRDPFRNGSGSETTRALSFVPQIHAQQRPPEFFTDPGADFPREPTAAAHHPPPGPPAPPRRPPRRHGEQHIQVPLRRLLGPLRRRLPAARRARLRRRARPRHPRVPAHQAGPRGPQPPRRLLRQRAGQLVQEAASGMEEGEASPDDAGGGRPPRGADAQEPPEGGRRRLPRLLRPPAPERGGISATAGCRRPPRCSGPAQRPRAQAAGRQVRAAHAPGGRQGGGGRRHGDGVRGHVGRPQRDQEGRGGPDQGARRQELPHRRRAPEDHRRRRVQDGPQRKGRRGARQEVQDQAEWDRRAGERDAVREGGQGGAAEAGGGQVPDGARLQHRPLRQVRRGSPRRRGLRAGANVEERLRVALHRLRQTPGACQVAEPGAGRPQGPVGVVQAAGAVGVQEGQAQRQRVIMDIYVHKPLLCVCVVTMDS